MLMTKVSVMAGATNQSTVVGETFPLGIGNFETTRPLRIAFCISRTFEQFQGTYGRYCGQARLLRDAGHDVTIFAVNRELNLPQDEINYGIPVHRVPVESKSWGGPKNFLNFRKMHNALMSCLQSGQWDAIKIIGQDLSPMIPMIQKRLRLPVIFDAHEPQIYGFWTGPRRALLPIIYGLEKRYSKMAEAIHITGNWQKNKYETWGCKDVSIVGNQPLWDERIDEWPEGKYDGVINGGPIIFGRLGTVYKGTGLHELLEAFGQIYDAYPDRARLKLAGKVAEYYEEEFANTIAPYRNAIELSGAYVTTDMPRLYSEMHVSILTYLMDANFSFINPSKFYDSVGNATPLAMTPIGDTGDYIERYKCGRTFDAERIETVVEAMKFYLDNPVEVEADARRAFEASLDEFHWKSNQAQLEETFQKIVG